MKKTLSLTMAAMLSLAMVGCGSSTSTGTDASAEATTAAPEAATEEVAETASTFEELLETPDAVLTFEGVDYTVGDFSNYAYTDLDQDGTDEMILSTTPDSFLSQDESAIVLTNVDGEITPIYYVKSEAGAVLKNDEADGLFVSYSRMSGEEHAVVYELKDGELNQVKALDSWEPGHGEAVDEALYQIDGADVSEEDYTAAWDQYYENATEISYDDSIATEEADEADEADEEINLYSASVDIDQDGKDEMIISTTEDSFLQQGDSAVILAEVDDETVPLLTVTSEAGAELRLDEADTALVVFTRFSGEQHAVVYELKDGKLEQVKTLDHWQPGHSEDSDNDVYKIDDETVSQEDFETAWKQYYENATPIAYPEAD